MSEEDTTENLTVFIMDPENPPPLTPEQKEMLDKLAAMPDSEIDYSDAPKCDFPPRPPKTNAQLRLDTDVLEWLSESKHGADWKANSILRHEMLRAKGRAKVDRRLAAEAAAREEAAKTEPAGV